MRRFHRGLAMLALLLCAVAMVAVPVALAAGGDGTIVFEGHRRDDGKVVRSIYSVSSSGGSAKLLALGQDPSISRNGKTVAFVRGDADDSNIWIMDAGGGDARPLIRDGKMRESDPALSPDGKKIVFVGDPKNLAAGIHLFIANVDGSGLRQLTRGNSIEAEPAFSPDGKRIAFIRYPDSQLMTMSVDGGDPTAVTSADGPSEVAGARSPSYIADGRQIVFSGTRVGRSAEGRQVFEIVADGKSLLPLTKGAVDSTEPAVSPNGKEVVFKRNDNLFTMSILGTDIKPLSSANAPPGAANHPSWGG